MAQALLHQLGHLKTKEPQLQQTFLQTTMPFVATMYHKNLQSIP